VKLQDCEGKDRLEYGLPYGQDDIIRKIAAVRPDVIFVNVSGSPVAMPWVDEVPAIVQAWYLGSETGNALADVLSGKVNPSGKLPFTFPVALADCPVTTEEQYPGILGEDGIYQAYYTEGIYVGYRWYEAKGIKPLFAFGHGLSYTTYEYGKAKCSKSGKNFKVSIDVTNTGDRAGKEIVQLYISDDESSLERPVKELKGFKKIALEPGETKTVTFVVEPDMLKFFDDAKHEWVLEKGKFTAYVGASSQDIRSEVSFEVK
jgi:beta-glucosidase